MIANPMNPSNPYPDPCFYAYPDIRFRRFRSGREFRLGYAMVLWQREYAGCRFERQADGSEVEFPDEVHPMYRVIEHHTRCEWYVLVADYESGVAESDAWRRREDRFFGMA